MARTHEDLRTLAEQIARLPREDQVTLLSHVLTPSLRLRLLLDRWHARTRRHNPRAIAADVNRAVREVRRARQASIRP